MDASILLVVAKSTSHRRRWLGNAQCAIELDRRLEQNRLNGKEKDKALIVASRQCMTSKDGRWPPAFAMLFHQLLRRTESPSAVVSQIWAAIPEPKLHATVVASDRPVLVITVEYTPQAGFLDEYAFWHTPRNVCPLADEHKTSFTEYDHSFAAPLDAFGEGYTPGFSKTVVTPVSEAFCEEGNRLVYQADETIALRGPDGRFARHLSRQTSYELSGIVVHTPDVVSSSEIKPKITLSSNVWDDIASGPAPPTIDCSESGLSLSGRLTLAEPIGMDIACRIEILIRGQAFAYRIDELRWQTKNYSDQKKGLFWKRGKSGAYYFHMVIEHSDACWAELYLLPDVSVAIECGSFSPILDLRIPLGVVEIQQCGP